MKKKHILSLFAFAAIITGFIYFGSNVSAQKSGTRDKSPQVAPLNNAPQTLPFSQDWTNTGLITTNDDWSGVPGIQGFLGQDIVTATGVDPRTILAPASAVANDLDVIANQTNPDTLASGGVAEFDTIANPSVALNGSGTADVPHIILYLNTTGQNNIRVQYDARDLDASVDNSIQQVNTQYRVGNTGNFINVPGGYIADASGGPSTATLVTHVDVTLPAAANNQPEVQVRIMTTNAAGNDEWIGVDNVLVNTAATPAPNRTAADFNGDGKTDFAITRNSGGLKTWWIQNNGSAGSSVTQFGLDTDQVAPADYDGDGKTDIAVWREAPATQAKFFILRSSNNTVQIEIFGQTADRATTVGDWDGDGKADVSVYRAGATAGAQSFFFYRGSLNNPSGNVTYLPWGLNGDVETSGDFDGDGKFDVCIQRDIGGQGIFILRRSSDAGIEYINWGLATDSIIPGDFDGDGKYDHAVARGGANNNYNLYVLERDGGGTGANPIVFALTTVNDNAAFGDYDGDGKLDIAVLREDADPTMNFFYVRQSSNGIVFSFEWGQFGDRPLGDWNITGR